MTRPFLGAALALALTAPAGAVHAQRVVPATINAVPRVELATTFDRVDAFNAAVQRANQARSAIPGHRMKEAVSGLGTLGFIALAVTQYQASMAKMDEGDGTGWETPGMVASLSIGGAIYAWMKWLDARSDRHAAEIVERRQLELARQLLPDVDPTRKR